MTSRSIYDSVSISIYMCIIFGYFPVYVGKTGNKALMKTNKFSSLISFIYLVLFLTMLYLGTLSFNPVTDSTMYNFNTLAKLLILVETLVGDFGTCALFIQGYFHKNLFKDFFNIVASIDKTFTKMNHELDHQKDFFMYVGIYLGGLIFALGNITLQVTNMHRINITPIPPVLLFTHLFAFCFIHHGESLFVTCNVILRKRFEAVNAILWKLDKRFRNERKRVEAMSDLIKNSKCDERILDACIVSHDKLCDLCDVVNRIFGFLVIVGCLIQFNTIVFAFCYCYYSISIRPVSTLGWFFWAIFSIYELARKAISAHMNTGEAKSTLHWVNKLLIHSDTHLEERLKMFALQIKHRTTPITALGLFPIDGSFAFIAIGATATYITIIYQFQVNKLGC